MRIKIIWNKGRGSWVTIIDEMQLPSIVAYVEDGFIDGWEYLS